MNKNNRWDYIDPQLQNMYKRQFARTIDNGQSTTNQPFMQKQPEYIDSDLIKQTMAATSDRSGMENSHSCTKAVSDHTLPVHSRYSI